MSNITLIGMPGSGKSTVGVLLAKALGRGFLDTDLVIQQQENALLQDILDRRGVTYFLDAEERAVRSVRCDHCVIAPGRQRGLPGRRDQSSEVHGARDLSPGAPG